MGDPLLVLSLTTAKEHLNKTGITQPGGDDELSDMIGAAVERVQRHLGGRELTAYGATFSEVLACKTVLAEYWRTQNPMVQARQVYGGQQGPLADDGPTAPVSLVAKLTALLGPPIDLVSEQPQGVFPKPEPWPDPARATVAW